MHGSRSCRSSGLSPGRDRPICSRLACMSSDTRSGGVRDLLERSAQLSSLADALAAVADGPRGRLVLARGEAGAGKTVLLRHFCEQTGGNARVLWGSCDPLFTPRPLGPLADIAQTTGGELAELVASGAKPHEVALGLTRELRAPAACDRRPRGRPLGRRGHARRAPADRAPAGGRSCARRRHLPRRRARPLTPAAHRAR